MKLAQKTLYSSNFWSKFNTLDKLYVIWHNKYKNVTKYLSQLKDTVVEIRDLKSVFSKR